MPVPETSEIALVLQVSAVPEIERRLGRFTGDPDGQDVRSFHAGELNAVFARWGGSRDN
ncbi:MAG TPA: hypothetical protein VKG22_05600 [Stellaceae bacterium]|nr:hypothetical protein [Stellaceae bacterium]